MFRRLVACCLVGLLGGIGAGAWADDQFGVDEVVTSEQREAMFASLSREVDELERRGNILRTVVKLASPSVVHIEARKSEQSPRFSGSSRMVEEAGSGVVIKINDGNYILTNRHVIKDAQPTDIVVKFADGRELSPTQKWEDRDTDVAVMAISGDHLTPARVGDSNSLEIGDFVLAVGSPFGLSHSVSYGIISAKGRRDLDLGDGGVKYQDFLQTDAAINPGNSGGPLLNLRGEVVGINTAIASNSGGNEGIGFSIPINMALVIGQQLVEQGKVNRAFLGVTLDSKFTTALAIRKGLPRRQGAHVTQITPNSPAQRAGLLPGDVILAFKGLRVESDNHLVNLISLTPVNSEVNLVVWRDGQSVQLGVRLGDAKVINR